MRVMVVTLAAMARAQTLLWCDLCRNIESTSHGSTWRNLPGLAQYAVLTPPPVEKERTI